MKTDRARLRKVSRLPLRTQVRKQLLELLSNGDLAPGDDLSEAQLSKALGVSRSPLREALLLLSHEGYIENIPHRGFFVPVPNPEKVAEVYTILAQLECLALRLSWERLPGKFQELETINRHVAEPGVSARTRADADRQFHKMLTGGSGNAILEEEIDRLWLRGRLYDGALRRGLANPEGSAAEHQAILEHLRHDDREAAVAELANHWKAGIGVVRGWIEQSAPYDVPRRT